MMDKAPNEKRIIAFDVLRIIAAFAVIWLHISAQYFYSSFPSNEWMVRNICDALVRWAVPVFVMISGTLFLDTSKDSNVRKLYSKNIKRILMTFLFWSIVYSVYKKDFEVSIGFFIIRVIEGPFHFWFLKMLIGLYIAIPLLRAIVSDKRIEQYFLCIAIITSFIIPQCFIALEHLNSIMFEIIEKLYKELNLNIALGYVGYFVLGHYLYTYKFSNTKRKIIIYLGCISFPAVISLTYWYSIKTSAPDTTFYSNLNLFTLFEATTVFLVIKEIRVSQTYSRFILYASKMSFGIYLIHILIIELFRDWGGIDSESFTTAISIPCLSVLVFALSLFIISILCKLPFFKQFVV